MKSLKLVFLILVLADVYCGTTAMGFCRFARTFPDKVKDGPGCYQKAANSSNGTQTSSRPMNETSSSGNRTMKQKTDDNLTTSGRSTALILTDYSTADHPTTKSSTSVHVLNTGSRSTFLTTTDFSTSDKPITSPTTSAQCPSNMVFTDCMCQGTCQDSNTCIRTCNGTQGCVCPDGFLMEGLNCISKEDCKCFKEGVGVISADRSHVNIDCSEKCTCENDQLSCNPNYECSSNAACTVKDNVQQCDCNDGYEGDGESCTTTSKDCNDWYNAGYTQDGVYSILPLNWNGSPFDVFCDMTIDGGSWMVFQRRMSGTLSFNQNWSNFKDGFGNILDEFWLGNEKLHFITNQATYELRIDLVSSSYKAAHGVKCTSFKIDDETNNYRIMDDVQYECTDPTFHEVQGTPFSTYDVDNDGIGSYNCAQRHHGGWWHGSKNWLWQQPGYCDNWQDGTNYVTCTSTNLNGGYNAGNGENIFWAGGTFCFIKYTEMKIRRI